MVVLGGTLRPLQHSLVDPLATLILEQISVKTVLLGLAAVDAAARRGHEHQPSRRPKSRNGCSRWQPAGSCSRTACKSGGSNWPGSAHDIGDVDMLITGRSADPAQVDTLRDRGCNVLVVG